MAPTIRVIEWLGTADVSGDGLRDICLEKIASLRRNNKPASADWAQQMVEENDRGAMAAISLNNIPAEVRMRDPFKFPARPH